MGTQDIQPPIIQFAQLDKLIALGRANSLWPMTFGLACCAIEMMATGASRFDLARFGAEVFRPSPRQSDVMIVAGTITKKSVAVVETLYDQMPEPKWVIAMGNCAISGGPFVFPGQYGIIEGAEKLFPVDVFIPGCPPRPEALIEGILELEEKITGSRRCWPRVVPRSAPYVPICRTAELSGDAPSASVVSAKSESPPKKVQKQAVAHGQKFQTVKNLLTSLAPLKMVDADYVSSGYHLDITVAPLQIVEVANLLCDEKFFIETITGVDWLGEKEAIHQKQIKLAAAARKASQKSADEAGEVLPESLPAEETVTEDLSDELEVVYDFNNMSELCRVVVRVRVPRDNSDYELPTISTIFPGANWHERETHDFFGIKFKGHPDLIPLLLPEDADYHPLLKDFKV